MTAITCAPKGRLTLERILFALAGTVILVGTVLSVVVSHWLVAVPLFVVVNMWLYAAAGDCPTSLLLRKLLKVERRPQP
jgi:hypothetical protein